MTTDIIKNEQLSDLLFDHAEQLDMDSDYWFRLRGQSINPMIDAVTPLLGLVQRVRLLSRYDRVPELYQRVVTEIQAIEQELMAQGYENGVVLSFRYILCTFIDEAVMGRDWGSQSEWSEHSLLTRFHNETWGGEKVFVLRFIQGRNPDWVQRPFFAKYDDKATWLDQLVPALGEAKWFWQDEYQAIRDDRLAAA